MNFIKHNLEQIFLIHKMKYHFKKQKNNQMKYFKNLLQFNNLCNLFMIQKQYDIAKSHLTKHHL